MALQLNTFLDRILEHVPEDKKAAVRAEYSRAQDHVSQVETELDAARAKVTQVATEQTAWWEANKDAVRERDQLRQKVAATPATSGVDQTELDKRLAATRDEVLGTGLGLVTAMTNLGLQHMKEFGEVLDTTKLAKDAIAAGKDLASFYTESVAPRRQEIAAAAREKELADARADERAKTTQELLSKAGQAIPYPVGNSAPTTLAGLRKPAEGQANPFGLEAAVATATQVAARQAGT